MYKIGYAWEPGELEKGTDFWTLDIDYEPNEKDALSRHGAIIQINGDSLAACLLRGKFICDMLNTKEFHVAENYVQLMELAKYISVRQTEFKETDDA